jgi:hypothetical protein
MEVKKHNMSVRKAARQFAIPRQILRDRTTGKIDGERRILDPFLKMNGIVRGDVCYFLTSVSVTIGCHDF